MKVCSNKRFLKAKKNLKIHQLDRKKRLKRLKERRAFLSARRSAWFVAQEIY